MESHKIPWFQSPPSSFYPFCHSTLGPCGEENPFYTPSTLCTSPGFLNLTPPNVAKNVSHMENSHSPVGEHQSCLAGTSMFDNVCPSEYGFTGFEPHMSTINHNVSRMHVHQVLHTPKLDFRRMAFALFLFRAQSRWRSQRMTLPSGYSHFIFQQSWFDNDTRFPKFDQRNPTGNPNAKMAKLVKEKNNKPSPNFT